MVKDNVLSPHCDLYISQLKQIATKNLHRKKNSNIGRGTHCRVISLLFVMVFGSFYEQHPFDGSKHPLTFHSTKPLPVLNKQMVTNRGMYTLNNSLLIICMCTTVHIHNKPLFCHVCLSFEKCLISRVLQNYVVPSESDLLSGRLWRAVVGPSQLIFFKPLSD